MLLSVISWDTWPVPSSEGASQMTRVWCLGISQCADSKGLFPGLELSLKSPDNQHLFEPPGSSVLKKGTAKFTRESIVIYFNI